VQDEKQEKGLELNSRFEIERKRGKEREPGGRIRTVLMMCGKTNMDSARSIKR
jgi:hypothetical protein